ncbi:hypothetical protein ACHRVW_20550 [Flavobacterium collinsii]|uniref:hypothetical protein n=1 Tax=Flavobacterium collinsii TaxID=1114861 RepID=UPI003756FB4C
MKPSKKIIPVLLLLLGTKSISQNNAVLEKSIFGIETGFLGFWINHETRLSPNLSLKSEFGLDGGIFGGDASHQVGTVWVPVITLEPRYYYNIQKRFDNTKIISNNNGNFIALNLKYQSDLFTISNSDISAISTLYIIPKWSIRRSLGSHFHYETGFGIGYSHSFENYKKGEAAVDLHLRIGYNL